MATPPAQQTKENGSKPEAHAPPPAVPPKPKGINLSARYPQYDPGIDVRDRKNFGKRGAVLHGWLLGKLNLPATIADDETGEMKPWVALCFELLRECPGVFTDPEDANRVETRMCPVGSKVIMTMTSAVESLMDRGLGAVLEDPDHVYEIYIERQASKTQGNRSLWIFPEFIVGPKQPRKPDQAVALPGVKAPAALGAGPLPSRVPFDRG